ncbi:PRC-barrel domain-containing protein [Longimicrobium sp.]|jgi:sporulation protein YlmC with PRC-barrel domain|uniref:PRC-barrel domain-containing protein n=1 Tax=Longimicrobium sp. TaxID=2029185 RepID=UPI002EDAFE39
MTMAESAASRAEVLRTRDLVGWAVADPAGATVGTVSDLLIGRDGRVRFLAVKRGLLGSTVLIPVEELDWGEQSMRLNRWLDADVRRLPPYDGDRPLDGEVVAEMERAHPRFYGPPLPFDALENQGTPQIVPLREARGFRLPKDAPNLRGWTVFGEDNERVGVVEDMLVDPHLMKVMYLDVDVADDLFRLRDDRHVVVPMEFVELRERGEDAWVHVLTAREIAALPAYTGGALDPLIEKRVIQAFSRESSSPALPPEHQASLRPRESRVDLPPPPLPERHADESYPDERYPDEPPPLPRRSDADY